MNELRFSWLTCSEGICLRINNARTKWKQLSNIGLDEMHGENTNSWDLSHFGLSHRITASSPTGDPLRLYGFMNDLSFTFPTLDPPSA